MFYPVFFVFYFIFIFIIIIIITAQTYKNIFFLSYNHLVIDK